MASASAKASAIADPQPKTKEATIDELMAQFDFEDEGKKQYSNATSNEGGGANQKKKGRGKR